MELNLIKVEKVVVDVVAKTVNQIVFAIQIKNKLKILASINLYLYCQDFF